jgi:hypothetical protein
MSFGHRGLTTRRGILVTMNARGRQSRGDSASGIEAMDGDAPVAPGEPEHGPRRARGLAGIGAMLICIASGVAVGIMGTMAHRMGASANLPYGLVVALLIVALSTWCARSLAGVAGLGLHLLASSAMAWGMAVYNPGGGALTPIGFGGQVPYFSEHAGYMWLLGMLLIQIALLMCPRRWFLPTRTPRAAQGEVRP